MSQEPAPATAPAIKVYVFPDTEREVHMVGNHVGVCWNLERNSRPPTAEEIATARRLFGDDVKITDKVILEGWHRRAPCYIDFVWVRTDRDGNAYEDEDSPVEGGVDIEQARQIAGELLLAIAYVKSLNKGGCHGN